jgi:hypothetical protein
VIDGQLPVFRPNVPSSTLAKFADATIRGATRLSWLRQAPGVASPKSVKQIVERLLFLRSLDLPALPASLHQNRVLQLARKASRYQAQPLLHSQNVR